MDIILILVSGLMLGGVYICVATGMSLVYGVMNMLNIAHGSLMMLGAFITYWLFKLYGIDPFISIPISMVVMFVFGYALQKYAINIVVRAPIFMTMIYTYAISLVIENIALYLWTGDVRALNIPYAGVGFQLGLVTISYYRIFVVFIAFVLAIGLLLFMERTWIGKAICATRMDLGASELMGVKLEIIFPITFGIGAALAGAGGSIMAILYPITPRVGGAYLFKSVVICVIGGLGDIRGAIVGGLIFGLVETLAGTLFGVVYNETVAFAVLVLVLLFAPRGIYGKEFY